MLPDKSVWTSTLPTTYDSGGIVQVTSGKAHSGMNYVRVKKGNDGQAFLQMEGAPVFPVASGPLYVRAWVNVPEWPPAAHVSWMEIGAKMNEQSEVRFGTNLGVLQTNQYPPDSDQRADGVVFAANEWHCLEYMYEQSSGSVKVWLDDKAVDALTITGGSFGGKVSMPFPPMNAIRFGAEINATEALFDDIAIGKTHLGCK
jgi:hypothetical protein